jgi:hypothetical protein
VSETLTPFSAIVQVPLNERLVTNPKFNLSECLTLTLFPVLQARGDHASGETLNDSF